jgi:hypothetical protein
MLIFPVREAASMKDFNGPIKNNFMIKHLWVDSIANSDIKVIIHLMDSKAYAIRD